MRCCDCEFRMTCNGRGNDNVDFQKCYRREQLLNNSMSKLYGKWEPIIDPYGRIEGWIHNKCGVEVKQTSNYCPNCGEKVYVDKIDNDLLQENNKSSFIKFDTTGGEEVFVNTDKVDMVSSNDSGEIEIHTDSGYVITIYGDLLKIVERITKCF